MTEHQLHETESLRAILYATYVSGFKGDPSTVARALTRSQRAAYTKFFMPFLAGVQRDARILDLGCGDGSLLAYLMERGFRNCQGVDCSSEQVALARERGVAAEVGNLFETLASRRSCFSVILAIDVIEHMTKTELAKLGRLISESLVPGGRIVVQTPNGEGLSRGHIVYGDLTHETIFNESSITQFLRAFGFERISVKETGPVPHSLFGAIRSLGWRAIRLGAQVGSVVQTGRWPTVLSATLIASGFRQQQSVDGASEAMAIR